MEEELTHPTGGISRRGAGAYTLCESCNSKTGAWYGKGYTNWAYEGFRLLEHTRRAPSMCHLFLGHPLQIIKQIACMFFSANPPHFREVNSTLSRWILTPKEKYWPSEAKVFVGLLDGKSSRSHPVAGLGHLDSSSINIFSEISFPPFSYILALQGECPNDKMTDITYFSNYSYRDFLQLSIKLPILNLWTPFPGDFRPRSQVLKEAARNIGSIE
jgi:hypothetical protein